MQSKTGKNLGGAMYIMAISEANSDIVPPTLYKW
jgi:hypothetical protein